MSGIDDLWLAGFVLVVVWFQSMMWRELRRRKGSRGFYLGLIFCCFIEALAVHTVMSSYFAPAALAIVAAIAGALACLAGAYGIAVIRQGKA